MAVGAAVARHAVGERVLVQTDYRHLPTPGTNAAFGYNFEGGLQEYVLLDERMIIEPGTGERFLIPVDEAPSGSAVALLEPWACVEASYASRERASLAPGGRLLVVADAGHAIEGLASLLAAGTPAALTAVVAEDAQRLLSKPWWILPRRGSPSSPTRSLCPSNPSTTSSTSGPMPITSSSSRASSPRVA